MVHVPPWAIGFEPSSEDAGRLAQLRIERLCQPPIRDRILDKRLGLAVSLLLVPDQRPFLDGGSGSEEFAHAALPGAVGAMSTTRFQACSEGTSNPEFAALNSEPHTSICAGPAHVAYCYDSMTKARRRMMCSFGLLQGKLTGSFAAGRSKMDTSSFQLDLPPSQASRSVLALLLTTFALAAPAQNIVINEIMYHPASHDVREEFVELFNA